MVSLFTGIPRGKICLDQDVHERTLMVQTSKLPPAHGAKGFIGPNSDTDRVGRSDLARGAKSCFFHGESLYNKKIGESICNRNIRKPYITERSENPYVTETLKNLYVTETFKKPYVEVGSACASTHGSRASGWCRRAIS
jgi:hypothetical protein